MEEYVRIDVYQANRETAERERQQLADQIKTEKRILEKDIGGIKEDLTAINKAIDAINDRTRWLLRSVGAAIILVGGNFVFLMLTRAA